MKIRPSLLKKSLYLFIFFLFLAISWRAFQSHIFNIHFVDEDENVIAGYYMSKGEKLYSDIFSHKQPLPAVIGMASQKVTNPNSLYLLIKREREVVFFYSVFWTIILILRFGFPGLVFGLSIEVSKSFLLGNLFLGESFSIFPAAYMMGHLWQYKKKDSEPPILDKFLFSFSLILIFMFLFALIPYAILAFLGLPFFFKKWKSYIPLVLFSAILGILVTIFFVDYPKYVENTLGAIQTHYLQATVSEGLGKIANFSLFRPLAIIFSLVKGDFGSFVRGLSLIYLLTFIFLFCRKKKLRKLLIISFLLLGVSSIRYIDPSATFYNGFHSLPWFGLLIWIIILQIEEILTDNTKNLLLHRLRNLGLLVLIVFLLYAGRFFLFDYYRAADRERDWYVNFSRFRDFGQVIKVMSRLGDKVIVFPVEQLIYWESGLGHATRFLYGYEWLFLSPLYRQEIIAGLKKTPPTFIYYDRASMGKDAWSIFDKYVANYIRIRRGDFETPLFVRKDRIQHD